LEFIYNGRARRPRRNDAFQSRKIAHLAVGRVNHHGIELRLFHRTGADPGLLSRFDKHLDNVAGLH
jgi:hypothetical protein